MGQVHDFTAIAVVGLGDAYLEARRIQEETHELLDWARKDPRLDAVMRSALESKLDAKLEDEPGSGAEPVYEVRHLERLPLRTPYTEVAWQVKKLMDTPPLHNNVELAVDATGVGAAVVDQLRAQGLWFKSVSITGGEREARDGNLYRVPKRDLVAAAQVLLQNRRLKIAPALPEAETLTEELLNFGYNLTPAGNDVYGAWREGAHDDLVLALCLAVWAAERRAPPMGGARVTSFGPYGMSDENLYALDDLYDWC